MTHTLDKDFRIICNEIIAENKSHDEWVEIESDDMFNQGNYSGSLMQQRWNFALVCLLMKKNTGFRFL